LAGTSIGAVVAIRFAQVMQGNIAAFAVAVVVTVLVYSALKLEESQRLAASTVALIMLLGHPQARWLAGIQRFLEVSFGIIVSLLVAHFIWPHIPARWRRKSLSERAFILSSGRLFSMAKFWLRSHRELASVIS
jgi:uncharacterized membrane protein YgaE (UPF0421/DUF939 family)